MLLKKAGNTKGTINTKKKSIRNRQNHVKNEKK